jgi:hypothetical protein
MSMETTFQLWDRASNNIVDEYATEGAALAVLRAWLEQQGPEGIERLALTCDRGGTITAVAAGHSLLEYVRSHPERAVVHRAGREVKRRPDSGSP